MMTMVQEVNYSSEPLLTVNKIHFLLIKGNEKQHIQSDAMSRSAFFRIKLITF